MIGDNAWEASKEKEYCPTCGQKLRYDDVTEECELKWSKHNDMFLIDIEHQGKHLRYLGIKCEMKQPHEQGYRIEEVYRTGDGSGWWFRVLKIRR